MTRAKSTPGFEERLLGPEALKNRNLEGAGPLEIEESIYAAEMLNEARDLGSSSSS